MRTTRIDRCVPPIQPPRSLRMTTVTTQPSRTPVLDDNQRTRCEVWTRVMGYHRPVSSFNTGKQGEFRERRFFVEERSA
uniref:Uncharacterized protein n=2 Tax=Ralstonia solanacearum TaxID=305 RepID=D8P6C5_RALSL|nr:conserved protein of unknown function [Ralstonia solanacearum CFBP2957]